MVWLCDRNPLVKFNPTKTLLGQQISPEVAFFSARGPNSVSPSVLKVLNLYITFNDFVLLFQYETNLFQCVLQPDIAAPGVNILSSWSPAYSLLQSSTSANQQQPSPVTFRIESGTSMACPHVSGIVALLKAIHPTWSPAAIKSALITTGEKLIQWQFIYLFVFIISLHCLIIYECPSRIEL